MLQIKAPCLLDALVRIKNNNDNNTVHRDLGTINCIVDEENFVYTYTENIVDAIINHRVIVYH